MNNCDNKIDNAQNNSSSIFKVFLVVILIAIASFGGWYYWANKKEDITAIQNVSEQYESLIHNAKTFEPKTIKTLKTFIEENKNIYGTFASLFLSRMYINNNQINNASEELTSALKNTTNTNMQNLIYIRLARIQLEENKADESLQTLKNIKDTSWNVIIDNLTGDALLKKGDKKGALDIWNEGIKLAKSAALREIMEMKVNELSKKDK